MKGWGEGVVAQGLEALPVTDRLPGTPTATSSDGAAATSTSQQTFLQRAEQDGEVDRSTAAFLRAMERHIRRRAIDTVAVYASAASVDLARSIAATLEHCSLIVVGPHSLGSGEHENLRWVRTDSMEDTHAILTAYGPFDALLDLARDDPEARSQTFRRCFLHLRRSGAYVIRSFLDGAGEESNVWNLVSSLVARHGLGSEEAQLAKALRTVLVNNQFLMVVNEVAALPKVDHHQYDQAVQSRPNAGLGATIAHEEPVTFDSRCRLTVVDGSEDWRFRDTYQVPELWLREYHDALVAPGQIAVANGILLPDTFRHYPSPDLRHRFLRDITQNFVAPPIDPAGAAYLPGSYFFLDSEWQRHFGHVITEQLSRTWGWRMAKERDPLLKALVSPLKGKDGLAPFEIELFGAAGISPSDLVALTQPVRVDRLVAATPMMVNPHYVHPGLSELWGGIGRTLAAGAAELTGSTDPAGSRLFCSRRVGYKRACHNAVEVEAAFARYGFRTVYPEDYSTAEQAVMFRDAEVIGGFAGSALCNLAFCDSPKKVVMISPRSYTARNEYMISSLQAHEITLLWCEPDIPQPEVGWSGKAFASGFSFDFERDGAQLEEVLAAL